MNGEFEITSVGRSCASKLWLVWVERSPVAQIEKFADDATTINPYKVFPCDYRGRRTETRPMVVFYPDDGGWLAAVKHALTYA
jgi:hypothetical protein